MLLRPRLVDPEEFVTLCTVVGSQTRRSDVAVVAEACALHEPLLGDEEQVDLFVEVPDRDDGRDLVVTVQVDEVDDRRPRAVREVSGMV